MSPLEKTKRQPGSPKRELVYVIDDEPLLLDLAEASLSGAFRVKKFDDPEQALKSFSRERTKPRLVITDYAMGKLNGVELITRCKAQVPALKCMLLSGTAGAEIVLNSMVKVDRFLGKPYQPTELLEAARQLLAG